VHRFEPNLPTLVSTILPYPSILAVQTRIFGNYVVEDINNLLELDDAAKNSLERLTDFLMRFLHIYLLDCVWNQH